MPKRIANNKIILYREGVGRIVVQAGKQFDFTAKELEDIKRDAPNSIRTPRNESEEVQEVIPPKPAKAGKNAPKAESKPEGEGKGEGGGAGEGDGEL